MSNRLSENHLRLLEEYPEFITQDILRHRARELKNENESKQLLKILCAA